MVLNTISVFPCRLIPSELKYSFTRLFSVLEKSSFVRENVNDFSFNQMILVNVLNDGIIMILYYRYNGSLESLIHTQTWIHVVLSEKTWLIPLDMSNSSYVRCDLCKYCTESYKQ